MPPRSHTDRPPALPFTFVGGCGHSGTTLIVKILAMSASVYAPFYEANLMRGGSPMEARRRGAVLAAAADRQGCTQVAEKTPRYVHHIPALRAAFPGARFILPVRDGRDVAASIRIRKGSVLPGIRRWIQDNRRVVAHCNAPDVLCYRHEDLITDPRSTLSRIADFIGVDDSPERLLGYHQNRTTWAGISGHEPGSGADGVEHVRLRSWQINQPLFDTRGAHENILDAREKRLVDHYLGGGIGAWLMHILGYADNPAHARINSALRCAPPVGQHTHHDQGDERHHR